MRNASCVAARFSFRPDAQNDLDKLYDWIADRAGAERAFAYVTAVREKAERVAEQPGIGTPQDDLRPGLRSVTYRRRTIILYKLEGETMEVVCVLHGGRDLQRALRNRD